MIQRTLVMFFLLNASFLFSQEMYITDTLLSTSNNYIEVHSLSWSADNSKLMFSAKDSIGRGIFIYDLGSENYSRIYRDSLFGGGAVWHSQDKAIVYDKKTDSTFHLFMFNIENNEEKVLFNRDISARQASFSNNEGLVVFSGLDPINDNWQVYTYDFVYDNLNQLTMGDFNCVKPVFSPDGKHILYEKHLANGDTIIQMINWYGNIEMSIDSIDVYSPNWKRDSWRFNFVVGEGDNTEVYSARRNGKSVVQITSNKSKETDFLYSSDNQKAAIVIEKNNHQELIILQLDIF